MSEKIKPALTAEEWSTLKDGYYVELSGCRIGIDTDGLDVRGRFMGEEATVPRECAPALMALANAALPDDDPRKITREDVAACRAFDFNFWGMESDSVEVRRADCERLQLLAAKLAALLPPEA